MYLTSGVDVVRLWIGPLPSQICFVNYFIKVWSILIYICVSAVQSIFCHQIFCIWKHMKIMNDDLIARLVILSVTVEPDDSKPIDSKLLALVNFCCLPTHL